MRLIHFTIEYLRERQSPPVLVLHITILCLVLSQIFFSNFMEISRGGEISRNPFQYYGTWIHINTGIVLLFMTIVFCFVELKRNGLEHFFPYMYGNFSQVIMDIGQLLKFKLPEPVSSGLAAVVQGLGMSALLLVVLSGAGWFISWVYMTAMTDLLKEIHETLTGLVVAYIIGHGGMGILHAYLTSKKERRERIEGDQY